MQAELGESSDASQEEDDVILTGEEIVRMQKAGRLLIDPFNAAWAGPNSYDLTLADELRVYTPLVLDMRHDNPAATVRIPPEGLILYPGELYLGSTVERCGSKEFVTCVEGRSSVGRLGIQVHLTAGVGDIGFTDRWTLEITVVKPVRVYAGVRVCQALFFVAQGESSRRYRGKYLDQAGAVTSQMYKDFGR